MRTLPCILLLLAAGCHAAAPVPSSPPSPAPMSDVQRDNEAAAIAVLRSIPGQEGTPAGQVFQNVKYLANVPARTLLAIMNEGYAKALGVRCTHCHVEGDYASDAKRPKRAAREMQVMHRMINQQLAGMQEIATPTTANRAINCMTCHRGTVNPH